MQEIHNYGDGYIAYYIGVGGSTYDRKGTLHIIHHYELHKDGVLYKAYATGHPANSVSSFDKVGEDKGAIEIFKNFV